MNEALLYGENIKCKYFSWFLLILAIWKCCLWNIKWVLSYGDNIEWKYCFMVIILNENIVLWW